MSEPVFYQSVLQKVEGNVMDLVYPRLKGPEQLTIEERLGNPEGKCEDCGRNEWIMFPKESVFLKESGKQYIECMNCGYQTHL